MTKTKPVTKQQTIKPIYRFAWANEQLKTWFITKHKNCKVKGSRLLYTVKGLPTEKPLCSTTTYPIVGDVVMDIDGLIFEIIEIQ